MKFLIFIICLFPLGHHSQITDSVNFKKVLNQLKLKNDDLNLNLATDKILPFDKGRSLFVLPKYHTKNETDGWYVYDFYLVEIDNKTGQIIRKYFEENAWNSDAEVLSVLEIDTGLYYINEKNRAIGIRRSYDGSSKLYPYNEYFITLLVPDNESFKIILKDFSVSRYNGIWDGNCKGKFEKASSFINFSKNKTNGFFDIILKTNHRKYINFWSKNDCAEKTVKQFQTKQILKFDGEFYK